MYRTFSELEREQRIGWDYLIRAKLRGSPIAVLAPHGGSIEPGSSELAEAIAGSEYCFYAFEGLKQNDNKILHIISTHFDEPQAEAIAAASDIVLTVHGCRGEEPFVIVGGLATDAIGRITDRLATIGISDGRGSNCIGASPSNICNRCRSRAGVQLELSRGLRLLMFHALSPVGLRIRSQIFRLFVEKVRAVLSEIQTCRRRPYAEE